MICPSVKFQSGLTELIKNYIINLTTNEIENIYLSWRTNFHENNIPASDLFKIVTDKKHISNSKNIPETSFLSGIDFPTWFGKETHLGKKIMIIGIDPLRNEKVFRDLNANPNSEVVIGTPYALHLSKLRNGKTKHYWKFVEKLAENNFVYLTDVYKTFFYTNSSKIVRSYDYYRQNKFEFHRTLFNKEIDLINPDLIITLGGQSYNQLLNVRYHPKLTEKITKNIVNYLNKPVLPFVHLSASTRDKIKLSFLEKNSIKTSSKNWGESYFEIIDNYLSLI